MSTKPKSKGKSQAVCIRCPNDDAERDLANHGDRLDKCQKELPADPSDANSLKNLWPNFNSGANTLDLSDEQTCEELIAAAREAPSKQDAEFQGVPITKSGLETAAKLAYPVGKKAKPAKSHGSGPAKAMAPKLAIAEHLPNVAKIQESEDALGSKATTKDIADLSIRPHIASAPDTRSIPTAPQGRTTAAPTVPVPGTARSSDVTRQAVSSRGPNKPVSQPNSSGSKGSTDQISQIRFVNELATNILKAQNGGDLSNLTGSQKSANLKDIVKKFGLRTSLAQVQQGDFVQTNYLALVRPARIYVYSLEMVRQYNANGTPVLVRKHEDKMLVVEQLQQHQYLLQQSLQHHSASWVTDGDLIWSVVPLFHPTVPHQVPARMFHTQNTPIQYRNEVGNLLTVEEVAVSWNQTIDLANNSVGRLFYDTQSATFQDSVPGILTRGLNAFLTRHVRNLVAAQPLIPNATGTRLTILNANKSFITTAGKPLDPSSARTLIAFPGYFLSARPGATEMLVNISHATSAFFENISVSEFVTRCRRLSRSVQEIKSILKGVKVQVRYLTQNNQNSIRFITNCGDAINVQLVTLGTTVQASFRQNQPQVDVRDGSVLAINTGLDPARHPGQEEWIPANQLMILPWNQFRGRLTGDEVSAMIKVAQKPPTAHRDRLLGTRAGEGLHHFGFQIDQPQPQTQAFLRSVNMSVGTNFVQIPARWLKPPSVLYHQIRNNTKDPRAAVNNASWNLAFTKFAERGTVNRLFVLDLSSPAGGAIPGGTIDFVGVIWQQLAVAGLARTLRADEQVPVTPKSASPVVVPNSAVRNESLSPGWEQAFAALATSLNGLTSNKKNVLVVLLPKKSYDDYATIKRVLDTQLGIQSICVVAKSEAKLSDQMASNLALKFNIKQACDVHRLDKTVFSSLRGSDGLPNTIVLGADVAHPTKGCHLGTPSIASVVGSYDQNFMKFGGSMRLQRGRQEDISALGDMVRERLITFAQKNDNRLPQNVLFYRDGVSESQYDILRTRELPQIQNAFNSASRFLDSNSNAPGPLLPQLSTDPTQHKQNYQDWADNMEAQANNVPFQMTFVVVGKRHNTRFYPTKGNQKTKNDNVLPGLAVDQRICHPSSMDFYLQSHAPIQGTGKSAHYFVLQNGMDFQIDKLQDITHAFCYTYARATRGVSYCAPAYLADRLCDRGRAYVRHFIVDSAQLRRPEDDPNNPNQPKDQGFMIPTVRPPAQHPAWKHLTELPLQGRNPQQSYQDWMKDRAEHIAMNGNYFRGWAGAPHSNPQLQQFGRERMNPWHPNLDDTMFWL